MHCNNRGDMGFNEAIVCMVAVSIVLMMYLAFAASTAAESYDTLENFDADSLCTDVSGGISISESYLLNYLASSDIRGISVTVLIPLFDDGGKEFVAGDKGVQNGSRSYLSVLPYDNGRSVPVILKVITYG